MQTRFTQPNRYVLYDTETTSAKADGTHVVQIALIETDKDFNVLQDNEGNNLEHMFYIRMRTDMIADPGAFLVHKVEPEWVSPFIDQSMIEGIDGPVYSQIEAMQVIQGIMTRTPNTAIAGYNSINFDDEVLRHNFYRTMLDPYQHEWSNGNHRCDVFGAVQLMRMYAESAMEWPEGDDGKASLKLEKLSVANGVVHEKAHDALSDIYATIHVAKLIKEKRPNIWEKFKQLADKKHVERLISSGEVLALTQVFIGKERYGTSLVMPMIKDPVNPSKHHMIDLTGDLTPLVEMQIDELREFMYTPKSKRKKPYAEMDFNIRSIKINACPLVNIPPTKNKDEPRGVALQRICNRIGADYTTVAKNIEFIESNKVSLQDKLTRVYSEQKPFEPKPIYRALYDGFFSDGEKYLRDSMLSFNDDGLRLIYSSDLFDVASRSTKDNAEKTLLLGIYAKWEGFNQWSSLNNISPTDANEILLYRDFVASNIKGDGEGIGFEKFKEILREYAENKDDLSEHEISLISSLKVQTLKVVERYQAIESVISPSFLKFAQKERESNPDKYDKFSHLFSNISDLSLKNDSFCDTTDPTP